MTHTRHKPKHKTEKWKISWTIIKIDGQSAQDRLAHSIVAVSGPVLLFIKLFKELLQFELPIKISYTCNCNESDARSNHNPLQGKNISQWAKYSHTNRQKPEYIVPSSPKTRPCIDVSVFSCSIVVIAVCTIVNATP